MTLGPFEGVNAGYVLELYERYRQNPESVDPATRDAFKTWTPTELEAELAGPKGPAQPGPTPRTDGAPVPDVHIIVGAVNLVSSIRRFGHLAARIDPLGSEPQGDPTLSPAAHGITEDDLKRLPGSLVGGPVAQPSSPAYEAMWYTPDRAPNKSWTVASFSRGRRPPRSSMPSVASVFDVSMWPRAISMPYNIERMLFRTDAR